MKKNISCILLLIACRLPSYAQPYTSGIVYAILSTGSYVNDPNNTD